MAIKEYSDKSQKKGSKKDGRTFIYPKHNKRVETDSEEKSDKEVTTEEK
jgi:hypothetical protein